MMRRDVQTGYEVYSKDGESLGRVTEVRQTFFKVDDKHWLTENEIETMDGARIQMSFEKDSLKTFTVQEPQRSQL